MSRIKALAVLVNYGEEQLEFLEAVVDHLKSFRKYEVTIVVQSNININISNIDEVNILSMENFQYLPLTCRKIIWEKRNQYQLFIYGENDHLFKEVHLDKHIEYSKILPSDRISGLLQYEENDHGRYYPAYHDDFDWDYKSVEVYEGKKFGHFTNLHQASFILTKSQLIKCGKSFDFTALVKEKDKLNFTERLVKRIKIKTGQKPLERLNKYSVKCKVNTDIYKYGGMKKLICITDIEDNLIHHLPNLYINGEKGRRKLRSSEDRMSLALTKLEKAKVRRSDFFFLRKKFEKIFDFFN
ncbi:hypothetical protein V5739_12665 [Salinimicrobium sp. TIG7-5_MAKvit]|uniref:hypothetical protein n=1 Tax=Salinimicrobium sp. TIG7-5_MAKvit TaxID=3121289 RepID=UPI003C6E34CD